MSVTTLETTHDFPAGRLPDELPQSTTFLPNSDTDSEIGGLTGLDPAARFIAAVDVGRLASGVHAVVAAHTKPEDLVARGFNNWI